jgi:endoglucanase
MLPVDGSLPGDAGQRPMERLEPGSAMVHAISAQETTSALTATLIELMELPGPTGQEEPVLAWCRERWAACGAAIRITPIGNVVAHRGGRGPRLLLQGHADEIGFVVKSIDARGFVWLDNGQGGGGRFFHDRYPVGQPALVIGRRTRIPGLFATPTGHILTTRTQEPARLAANDLFVDVGASSKIETEALGVHVGAGVIWNPPTRRLGRRIFGKAIDDRVALALMTHLLTAVEPAQLTYDLTIAATVQEEIGVVGATSLATPADFDLAIAIDNGPIGDYPGIDGREMPLTLGRGPTLVYKDGMVHYDRRIIDRLRDIAQTHGIPVQESTFPGFGSDGVALIRAGIPTALLGLATRYTHSAFEMLDERDLEGALALLSAFVTTPAEALPLGPS